MNYKFNTEELASFKARIDLGEWTKFDETTLRIIERFMEYDVDYAENTYMIGFLTELNLLEKVEPQQELNVTPFNFTRGGSQEN